MSHKTQELIRRFKASGLTQKAFCTRHSVPLSTLHYHLKRSGKQSVSPGSPSGFIALPAPAAPADAPTIMIVRGRFSPREIAHFALSVLAQ